MALRKLWFIPVIFILLLLFGLAANRVKNNPSATTETVTTTTPSFQWGGLERTYTVHLPASYDATKQYPVVLGLHGGFGSASQFEQSSGMSALADKRGFIMVYGQGTSWGTLKAPVWNAGGCCGQAVDAAKNVDDVGYAKEVMRQVTASYAADRRRLFVTGMSNGAMMANRLGCEAADVFSGIAAVSGTIQLTSCTPSKPLPVLLIHGTADDNVPYNGGVGSKQINQSVALPVEQTLADWAKRNSCPGLATTTPLVTQSSDGKTVDQLRYASCSQPTMLYRINGGIHEWPGGNKIDNRLEKGTPTTVLNASSVILDFFGI